MFCVLNQMVEALTELLRNAKKAGQRSAAKASVPARVIFNTRMRRFYSAAQ